MMWNGKEGDYNPEQMLRMCKVDAFYMGDGKEHYVTKILAILAMSKNPKELTESLKEVVEEIGKSVSIGGALHQLYQLATLGPELDYDRDGLDALTYHLSGDTCQKGIHALQAVMARFKINTEAKNRQVEEWHKNNPKPKPI